jgi:hypothetical protein
MTFYRIATSYDPKICSQVRYSKLYYQKRHHKFLDLDTYQEVNPVLPDLMVKDDNVLTDMLNCEGFGGLGLVISENAFNIFKKYTTQYRLHDIKVSHKGLPTAINYYYFQILFTKDFAQYIDFEQSVFKYAYTQADAFTDKIYANIDDFELDFTHLPKLIQGGKVTLQAAFFEKYGYVFYSPVHNSIVISENILNGLLENNITGFLFEKIDAIR